VVFYRHATRAGSWCSACAAGACLQQRAQSSVSFDCRDEIAGCSERAYESLSTKEAKRLMLFNSDKELASYAKEVPPPPLVSWRIPRRNVNSL